MERGKYWALEFLALCTALSGCTIAPANVPSKYEVFFAPGSSVLSPSTRSIVDHAAAAILAQRPRSVVLGAGGSIKGEALSDPRFDIVRNALVADGVNAALIVQAELPGEKMKGDGNSELRVEIQLVRD